MLESPTSRHASAFRSPDVETDVLLRDGSTVRLRRVRADDSARVERFFAALSPESRYFRFLAATGVTRGMVQATVDVDFERRYTLVAERAEEIVGVATWVRDVSAGGSVGDSVSDGAGDGARDGGRAEVSFAVADRLAGRGLGTRLLERLAEIARDHEITTFSAFVLADNRRMLDVFLDSGFTLHATAEEGVKRVVLDVHETERFLARAARRSVAAATASITPFFEPRVVAVVGASRTRPKVGAEILHNIRAGGFTGRVVPVNPAAQWVAGLAAFPRVTAIQDPVDLAVIAVPGDAVEAAVDDCLAKGVKALVIISAGFGETGDAGRAREAAILEKVRAAGARLVGPNCMGLINTSRGVSLNASMASTMPPAARVAFASQSGAIGLAVLETARRAGLGISSFVSVGNKLDVSGNDLIQYWAEDPRTGVILLYLESFGNPRKFSRIARRVARRKPIVAVKAGRSSAGARAASSHTGALAVDDRVVDALFDQAGIIRTPTLDELFDAAMVLEQQPLPAGPHVAIVTNAGGPGILGADACEADGLTLAPLSDATQAALRNLIPHAASVANPVDLLATASPANYAHALSTVLKDASVDSALVVSVPLLGADREAIGAAIAEGAAEARGKPVLAAFLDARGTPKALTGTPCFALPEPAARALARVTRYAGWRARPEGRVIAFEDVEARAARAVVDGAIARGRLRPLGSGEPRRRDANAGGGWLTAEEVTRLCDAIGLPMIATRAARSDAEARAAARALGLPVALKAFGPTIVHKTDVGGVRLGLATEAAVDAAWRELQARLGTALEGVLVQPMAAEGPEMLVGAIQHPVFGPLVACGGGGVLAEVVGDTVFRLHPLTDVDAADMLAELKSARLLRGFRGAPPADEAALGQALLRVSHLLEICPGIQELDLNPVRVLTHGLMVLDARVRVETPTPPPPSRRVWYS